MRTNIMTVSVLLQAFTLLVIGCTGVRPSNLGVRDHRLSPCPASSNCVSSGSSDHEHAIAPLSFTGTSPEAYARLKTILLGMKRPTIITETSNYLHVEFTSAFFRFVDDAEFLFDENTKVIQVRSASRLGHGDFGVNRKRVEEIRARWKAAGK